jgi:hypothetical protein
MARLYRSILTDDYTLLPTLFYVPVFAFLSRGNTAFVLTGYNLFGVPFLLLTYGTMTRRLGLRGLPARAAALLVLFTCTVFLTPLMGGYLDACGLVFAAWILWLAAGWDLSRIHVGKSLYLAALVLILCFLRRWYVFWVAAFFLAYFLCALLRARGGGRRAAFSVFVNLFAAGAAWLLILFLFFREFLERLAVNNFSFAYSAYDFGGARYSAGFLLSQSGAFLCCLAAVGAVLCLRSEKNRLKGVFFLAQSAVSFLLFTRVQSLGIQHLYLFVPALLFFAVYGAVFLPEAILTAASARPRLRFAPRAVSALIALLVALNFSNSYFREATAALAPVDAMFAQKKLYRRERADIGEIQRLVAAVNALTRGGKYAYALASSDILNTDILTNAELPGARYAVHNQLYTYDVDKRDGFPPYFYLADVLVVASPVQLHLSPDDQRVVGVPAAAILAGEAGDSLERVGTFVLDGGVEAYLYERVKPYSREFLRGVDGAFKAAYPEYDFLNDTYSVFSYIYDTHLPDSFEVLPAEPYAFKLGLGAEPADFCLSLAGRYAEFTFSAETETAGDAGWRMRVTDDGGEELLNETVFAGSGVYTLRAANCQSLRFEIEGGGAEASVTLGFAFREEKN